jgi:hypothetical protein
VSDRPKIGEPECDEWYGWYIPIGGADEDGPPAVVVAVMVSEDEDFYGSRPSEASIERTLARCEKIADLLERNP